MFLTLLLVTFVIALLTSLFVACLFSDSIRRILRLVVAADLAGAWHRYLMFALFVVGVSGGARILSLERYVNPRHPESTPLALTSDRWILEVYRTVIETVQSAAWMLLVAYVILLLAYVVARGLGVEPRTEKPKDSSTPPVPPA